MSDHDTTASTERAIEIIAAVAQFIPPCPDCQQLCSGWIEAYLRAVLSAYVDPIGPLAILSVMVARAGAEGVLITRKELEDHGADGLMFRAAKDSSSYLVSTLNKSKAITVAEFGLEEDDNNLGTIIVIKDDIG